MHYQLSIKENAIDSFNEALAKFDQGQNGDVKAYKFAILHTSHFLELVLKIYIISIDENLVFSKCFREVEKVAKENKIDLLAAHQKMKGEGKELDVYIKNIANPHTITLDQALEFCKNEKCKITQQNFIDDEFSSDIEWLKDLRNNIEHFQFSLPPKDVRLCIGRIVRSAIEFLDIFSLFDLEQEIGSAKAHVFEQLADEYTQSLTEAKLEVREKERDAFLGVRPKFHQFVNWNIYVCPECGNNTMIPNDKSTSGYQCTFCKNEESEEIEVPCDCCGANAPNGEMVVWHMDNGEYENRCYFCSGQYAADNDKS